MRKLSFSPVAAVLTAVAALVLNCCESAGIGGSKDPAVANATKVQPFVNTLGMKFVPVPGTRILMCTTETTVGQYQMAGLGYKAPKFPQGSNHCAVNISQNDAKAWCRWLSQKEGKRYRLPTDAEWSAAVGGGTYPWGNQWPPPDICGNYMGQEHKSSAESVAYFRSVSNEEAFWGVIGGFRDHHVFTAPVGSYPANGLGIHDLGGNAEEWVGDKAALRGGSWLLFNTAAWNASTRRYDNVIDSRADLASSKRSYFDADYCSYLGNSGFRCVLER